MTEQLTGVEPPRIKKLRRNLIGAIPRFPNTRASLQHMQGKHLGELLIDYFSWRARYVGVQPRTVKVEPAARATPVWAAHSAAITALLEKVERGDDLTPHLSLMPHTQGYSPASRAAGATSEERWSDKDFLLNAMNYHHFHLGTQMEARGHIERTDDVIFAEVTRDEFKVIAIFDHSVFDSGSQERLRLWAAHDATSFRNVPPGAVVSGAIIATSGHPIHIVNYAAHCSRIIRDLDPKLDDRSYIGEIYEDAGLARPSKPKPEWALQHLDLGIHDPAYPAMFFLARGWN